MEERLYSELDACLQKLSQWTCSLDFPDNRYTDGTVDLLKFSDYNSYDWSLSRPSSVECPSYPSNTAYRFDECTYGAGLASEGALKNDLMLAARQCGFALVVDSSHNNKSKTVIREVRFACSRGRMYQGDCLDQLSAVSRSCAGVLLHGVKSQPLRRSKGKSQVAFSLCSGSGNDNSNICSTPFLRKTYSYRPSCKTDVCPFRFCIFLSADNFWYIRLSQVVCV